MLFIFTFHFSALIGYNLTGGASLVPDDISEQLKDLLEKTSDLEARFSSLKPMPTQTNPKPSETDTEEQSKTMF